MFKIAIASVLLLFLGCGKYRNDKPTFTYKGIEIYVDAHRSDSLKDPGFRDTVKQIIDESTAYWGTTPEALSEYQIIYTDDTDLPCGIWPFVVSKNVVGCTKNSVVYQQKVIILSLNGLDWVGESPLPHEVGHTVGFLGDSFHMDDRFRDYSHLWDQITDNCYENPTSYTESEDIRWIACQATHPGWFKTWKSPKGDWYDYIPSWLRP